jgi:hypothetical protein
VKLHFFVGLRTADSGEAGTERCNFAEFNARFTRGGLRGLRERGSCGFVADAKRVLGAGARGGPDLLLGVEQNTFSFGAAAIESQNILHGMRIFDLSAVCRTESQNGCEDSRLLGAAPSVLRGCGFRFHFNPNVSV